MRYDKWQEQALQEYNNKFHENRLYYEVPAGDYDPAGVVEFSENGGAYPHSAFGTGYIPHAVSPYRGLMK